MCPQFEMYLSSLSGSVNSVIQQITAVHIGFLL